MDKQEIFPDGTVIDKWFYDINIPELSDLGKQYVLTDNNVLEHSNHPNMFHTEFELGINAKGHLILLYRYG